MNKSMIVGGLIGAAAVTAGGVGAVSYYQQTNSPAYAEVLTVTAQHKSVTEPRQYCENVEVTEQAAVKDENRVTGTVAGAIIGGILGNQVGGGSGNKLATVAGAAAGAYAGNKVQQNAQENNTTTRTEQQCVTRNETRKVLTGYQVEYKIGDSVDTVVTEEKPSSKRYEVEDGKPSFDKPVAESAA